MRPAERRGARRSGDRGKAIFS